MSRGRHQHRPEPWFTPCPTPWCRKRAYATRRAARDARDVMRRAGRGLGEGLAVYRCPGSGLFHLGHRDPRFIHRNDAGQP